MAEARTWIVKQPATVIMTHDGLITSKYLLGLDGKTAQELPVSARAADGTITFAPVTFDTVGDHKVTVTAANENGATSLDTPFKVVEQAGALPSKPTVAIVIQLVLA